MAKTRAAGRRTSTAAAYHRKRAAAGERERRLSFAGREIGPIPPVADSDRKAATLGSFRLFCEAYFPKRFYLPWSPDHLRIIAKIERSVTQGALLAMAMPRGGGKTTLCEVACIWAAAVGSRKFVFLLSAVKEDSVANLTNMKTEMSRNDTLLADYPEVFYPIWCLENEARRCVGQLYCGQPTFIHWGAARVVLPTIPGSRASGSVIHTAGLEGRIRGAMHVTPEGEAIRPDLVILDDPQTDESARNIDQSEKRLRIINQAVLGLAGPKQRFGAIMPCTVIQAGDLSDTLLDRKRHPEWQGERTKMVYAFPKSKTARKLWDEYASILKEDLAADGDGSVATRFYTEHRKAMDRGAQVAWPERFRAGEISGLQCAMNLKIRDEAAFFAEYQNEPLDLSELGEMLTVQQIASKTSGVKRAEVPGACVRVTAAIDVHKRLLYWVLLAWGEGFAGSVIDYGTYPDQKQRRFTERSAPRTLGRAHRGMGPDAAIQAGLEVLIEQLAGRELRRTDGAVFYVERCLIDAGHKPELVEAAIRRSGRGAVFQPSRGLPIKATSTPWEEYKRKKGERRGAHWKIPRPVSRRALRTVFIDVNFWKTFVHSRLATSAGDPGCLELFGRSAEQHRMFAEHLTSEFPTAVTARGRTVEEWALRPGAGDNHWLDCLVYGLVAESLSGGALAGMPAARARRGAGRKRVKLSDLQKQRRMEARR